VATDRGLSLSNNALNGDQACDLVPRQIFPGWIRSASLSSVLAGTNDVDFKGAGPYEAVYTLCLQGALSWLAVPAVSKVLAGGPGVSVTGPGHLDSFGRVQGWTMNGQGASISFTIDTSQRGPVYAWPQIDDANPGTYSYSLDGVLVGAGAMRTFPAIATHNRTSRSLGFIRLPVMEAGRHVVSFTQTGGVDGSVTIFGIGQPAGSQPLPTVLVGTVPYQLLFRGSGACTLSEEPCQSYNRDLELSADLFAVDGLDVRVFDTRQYMMGNPSEMLDSVHPNAVGQTELSRSVEGVF
jgi:hypothetical protein